MIPEVIEILSDNEEMQVMKDKQFKILQRQLQDKAALLKTPVGVMLAVSMQTMKGTPEEKEKVLMERIQKMFLDKEKLDISKQHFCLRRQPHLNKQNCDMVLNQIMIFGTDFWTTTQITNEAKGLKFEVEAVKIDNSHTKLIFGSSQQAKKWLQFYIKDKSLLKTKMQQQDMEENILNQYGNRLKGWFDLASYRFQGFDRIRQARFCLTDQKNIQQLQQTTMTSKYEKFIKMIEQQFTKNDQVKMSYEMVYQREYNQPKYHKRSQFSMFRNNRSFGNRSRGNFKDRSEHGLRNNFQRRSRSRDSRQRTRQKRNYGRDRRFNQDNPHNRTTMNRTLNRTRNNYDQRQNQTAMANQTSNIDQTANNISQLLDQVNNDNIDPNDMSISIEKQLNQMKIQDPLNMSIDLVQKSNPNQEDDNKSNMSVFMQKDKDRNKNEQKQARIADNSQPKMNKSFANQKQTNKVNQTFDYYKYVEEQQKKSAIKEIVYKPK